MDRVDIFIDSGNFYHLVLKKLSLKELDFNFEAFANFLAIKRKIVADGKRFYVGTVREKQDGHENKKAMENQTRLFSELQKNHWCIKTSKLRTRNEKIKIDDRVKNYREILKKGILEIEYQKSREKGIDVKLAVDLMAGAIDDRYDTAIVVSSDTDLVPAIDWVRKRFHKKIEYIGFSIPNNSDSTRPTKTMIFNSDIQRVLIESDIRPFVKEDSIISYLKTLNIEDWNLKVTSKWTVKDVVAHLVGWEKRCSQLISPIWENKRRDDWLDKNEEFDDFNKKAVEYYRNYTPEELISEFKKWQNAVQIKIDKIGEKNLKTRMDLFDWLFEESEDSHYNHHLRQIKKTTGNK